MGDGNCMERKCLSKIIEWNNNRKKPLVVFGARQIGKTYLIKDIFAERFYENNYIYIDFKKDTDVREFINGNGEIKPVVDAKKIVEYISLREKRMINKNTLLIFDEIQECLPFITSLKYFKQDLNEIPVIATGSMVRIKIKRKQKIYNQKKEEGFFYPIGAISELYMFPVTFEEFLYNENKILYDKINNSYLKKIPLDSSVHEMALNLLYKYFLIGGMPENVQMYLENNSLLLIRNNIKSIFNDYLNDMDLYQVSSESIVRSKMIFNSLYRQLNKESKNFKPSLLETGFRTRDLISPIDWLITSGIVYKSEQLKEQITIPFKGESDSNYRLYMMDLGFLAYQSDINMSTFINKQTRNELSGAFFENYVASELISHNFSLFFWKGKNDAEFEFIINDNEKIVPIDVKKGKGKLNSLTKFKEHNKFDYAVKVSSNNYGYDSNNNIETIPLYMLFAYLNDLEIKKYID